LNAHCFDLPATPFRIISLSDRREVYCLVDADDFGWLSENTWNISWGSRTAWQIYAKRNIGRYRATVRMHREIMVRRDPRSARFMASHHVDHINGQTLDNRLCNLRWATNAENSANRRLRAAIPSIEQILAGLMAEHAGRLEAIPF